jgi:putative endonuclease
MYYFYVIQSLKDPHWFYKGSTNDLRRRFTQHQNKEVQSTRSYHPLRIVYYEAYVNEKAARSREIMVKKSGSSWGALMKRIKESL